MYRPILATLAVLALGLAAAGCGGDDSGSGGGRSSSAATQGGATTAAGALPAGCRRVAQPRARAESNVPRPAQRLARKRATVTMRTNCGTFAIRLAVGRAPRTASSFAGLVSRGFYDGLTFHRIAGSGAQSFVIQGGDPLGTGLGGPGFSVVERPPPSVRYTRYTVAMAKAATEPPGASGSQFFVVTAADAGLPPEYALVGRVTEGTDVIDRISSVKTGADERPVAPVVIQKATLETS